MRIACIQFSPALGHVAGNIAQLDALIEEHNILAGSVDLMLLPELALTGYNFPSLRDIKPYLEVQGEGPSSKWAQRTAQRLGCIISVGYPEKSHNPGRLEPKTPPSGLDKRFNFNSNVMYGPDGSLLGNYRKSFLFPTDLTWASEPVHKQPPQRGDFFIKEMPAPLEAKLALGICMDINPYKFIAPAEAMEFATHVCASEAAIAIVSLAWSSVTLHAEDIEGDAGDEPDLQTLAYWVGRFKPVIQGSRSVVLVMANRCGVEGDACYVGSSLVARLGRGKVEIWEALGKGVTGVVMVDTDKSTKYMWQEDPPLLNPM